MRTQMGMRKPHVLIIWATLAVICVLTLRNWSRNVHLRASKVRLCGLTYWKFCMLA